MITWANLRSSAAPWLLLPALLYTGLYIDDVTYTAQSGYGVESGELASYGLAVIAPAAAGAAAWDAGRHRLLGAVGTTGARRLAQRLLWAAAPALALQCVLTAGALVMARRAVGVWPSGAGWLAVAHLFVLPLGWLAIGWLLGGLLPRSVAAPAAGIGCWAWLSVPHTLANAWMRHLGGFVDGTSTVTDVRDPAVYLVPWLVVSCLALSLWPVVSLRRRAAGLVVGVLAVALTLITGRMLVAEWGYQRPTSPRAVALTCSGESPKVCVPPEYEPYVEQLRKDALAPLDRLRAAGVTPPRELRITSSGVSVESGTWPLYWSLPPLRSQTDVHQYRADLARSAVVGTAGSAEATGCPPASLPTAWAMLVMGMDESLVRERMLPADWSSLQGIRRLSAQRQADWFGEAAVNRNHCPQART
ncbi:DUF7224 domain-containing protein [Streptomyces pacificus]|uniref:DUF7224 domain-containing protein n=1 Tax=Streptomyces pacificus TaxID=2705029 RepID=A0A6A0AZL0_9ACTN|nr:hypothetical protein [Streptomyces pacificus]GFH37885.1 hypothetical protein SCWH03_41250 [Streptomyces pacificus]